MKHTTMPCTDFLNTLDCWLAGELHGAAAQAMQTHHEHCPACRLETQLARKIDAITGALPEPRYPEHGAGLQSDGTAVRLPLGQALSRLLQIWRQPLVYGPALMLVLATLLLGRWPASGPAAGADTVEINGQTYSRADLLQAAQELELVLRYLDRYGSYPARVVGAGLDNRHLPLPPSPPDAGAAPAI